TRRESGIQASCNRYYLGLLQHAFGQLGDLVGIRAIPVRGGNRNDDVAAMECVLIRGEPARGEQLTRETALGDARTRRTHRKAREPLELRPPEAMLARPGEDLLAPVRIGALSFNLAGGIRDPLATWKAN